MKKPSGLGAMMVGGPNGPRQDDDFYPTPPDVTDALMASNVIPQLAPVWEPCAGNGAMGDRIRMTGRPVTMTDLSPRRADVRKLDFFSASQAASRELGPVSIITNPPFNLAEGIIRHAREVIRVPILALVLKSTYWHAGTRQRLYHEHRPAFVMPLTWRPDFLNLGRPTMEVMWCVWDEAVTGPTTYIPLSR